MKKCLPILFVFAFLTAFSQQGEPSKEDEACFLYRRQISQPPYGLHEIRRHLIFHYGKSNKLDTRFYQSLPLRKRFTYHMINGESFMQNCSIELPQKNDQHMLFAELPRSVFGEYGWNAAQYQFFMKNRDSVISLIRENMQATGRVGLNFKAVIIYVNAREITRPLLDLYQGAKVKDRDVLTVLILLMRDNKYGAFLSSSVYNQLYGPASGTSTCIAFTKDIERLIIANALKFSINGSK